MTDKERKEIKKAEREAKKALRDQIKRLDERAKIQQEASKDLESYIAVLQRMQEFEKAINKVIKDRGELKKANAKIDDDIIAARKVGDTNKINALTAEKTLNEGAIADSHIQEKSLKEQVKSHEEALKLVNKTALGFKAAFKWAGKLGQELLYQKGYLLSQQKAVKETELRMGVLSKQASAFRDNIYKTSISTTQIGIDTKDLAKIQGTYSDDVGRALILNQDNLEAVAEMAAGTVLGAEGAAELAANMENFGISAKGSRDLVKDMLNSSHKMGLNAGKVIKTMQKNLKLAQTYHFKGGIKGLARMAALTTKFKLEMETVAGFADKLITPEGAVEMAASLQVLGGAWSKLGDPFELMFRARNDMEGLTQDIIEAAKGTARWNEETGEFKIDPMELHRLREVANVTGMSAEELATMTKEQAKFNKIRTETRGISNEDNMEFIESLAQYNEDTKQFEITFQENGRTFTESVKNLRKIGDDRFKNIREENASLKERAKQSLTFQDRWENLLNTFKAGILPAFDVIAGQLEGWITSLEPHMKKIADFMAEEPIWISRIAKVLIGLKIIGDIPVWFGRGVALGRGFNASTGGGFFGKGKGGGFFGKGKGGGGKAPKGGGGKAPKGGGGKGGKFGKMSKGLGKGVGALAAIGAVVDGYQNFTDDDLTGWEAALKTLDENKFLALGAVLAPFTGGASLMLGAADMVAPTVGSYGEQQDFVSRPGEKAIPFSSDDTLVGAKTGGPIDKLLNQQESLKNPSEKAKPFSFDDILVEPKLGGSIDKLGGSIDKLGGSINKIFGLQESTAKPNEKEIPFNLDNTLFGSKLGSSIDKLFGSQESIAKPSENPIPFNLDDTLVEPSVDKLGGLIGELVGSQESIAKPSENPVSFNEDKSLGLGGNMIKKIFNQSNDDKSVAKASNINKMSVEFAKPIKIEGSIDLKSGDKTVKIDLDDPILMREVSRVVQEQLTKAINGAKASSNPIVMA
jgi:hypothetical protein